MLDDQTVETWTSWMTKWMHTNVGSAMVQTHVGWLMDQQWRTKVETLDEQWTNNGCTQTRMTSWMTITSHKRGIMTMIWSWWWWLKYYYIHNNITYRGSAGHRGLGTERWVQSVGSAMVQTNFGKTMDQQWRTKVETLDEQWTNNGCTQTRMTSWKTTTSHKRGIMTMIWWWWWWLK